MTAVNILENHPEILILEPTIFLDVIGCLHQLTLPEPNSARYFYVRVSAVNYPI